MLRTVHAKESFIMNSCVGHSPADSPIFCYQYGPAHPSPSFRLLILAGVHGDEHEGVALAFKLIEHFQQSFDYQISVHVIPVFNPDGMYLKKRTNINDVDLNRNLPT